MLYLVATPIGHLADISPRALQALRDSDSILCEDTRVTQVLLKHYGIDKPTLSYHRFEEAKKREELVERMKRGTIYSLVSDAGTPCINDPGSILVEACIQALIPVTSIPGACSPIVALTLSGFPIETFQYVGFIPKKGKKNILTRWLHDPGITVALESPERLVDTLFHLQTLTPNREGAIARELTKKFEECQRGSFEKLYQHFQSKPPKGEIILIIGPGLPPEDPLPLEELISLLKIVHALSLREAIQVAAKLTNRPKSQIYKEAHFPTQGD